MIMERGRKWMWAGNWKHVWQTCVRVVRHAFYALTRFPYSKVGLTNPWHVCPKRRAERFYLYAAFTPVPVLFYFFRPTSVCILWRMCVCVCLRAHTLTHTHTHTHIWLRRDCMWNTVATKKYCEWNIFTQIGSDAKCWLDIYHRGAVFAVTGRIHDIGQNVLHSSFQIGSSSSPSYCHIFFPVAFLENDFFKNVM